MEDVSDINIYIDGRKIDFIGFFVYFDDNTLEEFDRTAMSRLIKIVDEIRYKKIKSNIYISSENYLNKFSEIYI